MAAEIPPFFKHSFERAPHPIKTKEEFCLDQISTQENVLQNIHKEEPNQLTHNPEANGRVPDKVAVVVSEVERKAPAMEVAKPSYFDKEAILDSLIWPSEFPQNRRKQKSPLEDTLKEQVKKLSEQDLDTFICELTGFDLKTYSPSPKSQPVKIIWAQNTLARIKTGSQQCPYPRDKFQFERLQSDGLISQKTSWASIWPGLAKMHQ